MQLEKDVLNIIMPENLLIGMMVQKHRHAFKLGKQTHDYYNFVLGQSPFHTPYILQDALAQSVKENFYSPAKGISRLIEEVAAFNKRHFDLDLDINQIVVGTGTKMIMYMLLRMLKGHFIVPAPAWIGYIPLLRFLNKSHETLRLKASHNYKVTPEELDTTLSKTNDQTIFILNNPHNPTGALYSQTELKALTQVLKKHNTIVISDEIYALTTYHQKDFVSMAKIYPERTFVTNGISKDRSAAGYRLGTCILPTEDTERLKDTYVKFASTLYTNVPTPIQHAAITAYQDHQEIKDYMDTTRKIHTMAGRYFSKLASSIQNIHTSTPHGGFYFIIDFNNLKDKLNKKGINSAQDLTQALLKKPYYIALVTGDAIAIKEDDFIARIAFVDYEGEKIFHHYQKERPKTIQEENTFIETHMRHMIEGFNSLKQFIQDLD